VKARILPEEEYIFLFCLRVKQCVIFGLEVALVLTLFECVEGYGFGHGQSVKLMHDLRCTQSRQCLEQAMTHRSSWSRGCCTVAGDACNEQVFFLDPRAALDVITWHNSNNPLSIFIVVHIQKPRLILQVQMVQLGNLKSAWTPRGSVRPICSSSRPLSHCCKCACTQQQRHMYVELYIHTNTL